MSVVLYRAHWLGVDRLTVASGEGLGGQPQVVSMAAQDANTMRITFDRDMRFKHEAQGAGLPGVLQPSNYVFTDTLGNHKLVAVRVKQVSPTVVDVVTNHQVGTTYEVRVVRAQDQWRQDVDPANNTAQATGLAKTYPAVTDLYAFYGMYTGMQESAATGVDPDIDPPILQNQNPLPSATNVAVDTNIVLDVVDLISGVNPLSVQIYVNAVLAWNNDAAQPGFAVVKTPVAGGYNYSINPDADFSSFQTVPVHVIAQDTAPLPNELDTTYTFRIIDIEAPVLQQRLPSPGQTGVSPLTTVRLDVVDTGDGVDITTVVITIDSVIAWSGDAQQNGFTVTKTPVVNGYRYEATPPVPFDPLVTIQVDVQADDLAPVPNSLNTSYSFTTSTDVAPEFTNKDPADLAKNVSATKVIEVDVVDNYQVDEVTVIITVNGIIAYQNSAEANGFSVVVTPAVPNGYHYAITGPLEWPYGSTVVVTGFARDTLNTPASDEWSFQVITDTTCFSGPITAFEATLLTSFTLSSFVWLERLRLLLLDNVSTAQLPNENARTINLRAHSKEFRPVLRQIVPTPTAKEEAVRLCNKQKAITAVSALNKQPTLLRSCLKELRGAGLPVEHQRMLDRYIDVEYPDVRLSLACVLVLIAKAIDNGDLV